MIEVNLDVQGLNKLEGMFRRAPEVVRTHLNNAIKASIFEVLRLADDSGDSGYFRFKTPRQFRTGLLSLSFRQGITFSDLQASIGPRVNYAPIVHKNNPFMKRIAEAATPAMQKHFEQAVALIVKELQ
jgi:hypothetical protein